MQQSDIKKPSSPGAGAPLSVDALVQEIRRVGGWHSLGATASAVALMPFIAALQQPSGWQPIETAPKNGRTLLLGYFNTLGKWWATRGQWCSRELLDEEWEDGDLCDEGWYETPVEHEQSYFISPTHWMPLPSQPEVQP